MVLAKWEEKGMPNREVRSRDTSTTGLPKGGRLNLSTAQEEGLGGLAVRKCESSRGWQEKEH